jgi:signal transduction histidine kinase/ActR/RegA family two-component response regulator
MATDRLPEQAHIDEELLRLLAQQARRIPYPVAFSALLIAVMAGDNLSPWLAGAWLLLVLLTLVVRHQVLGRLPQLTTVPMRRRMQWAVGLSLLNGLVFSGSLAFAPYLTDYERMVQTVVLLGLCAGSVATTAGSWPLLLAYVGPISLANSLAWFVGSAAHVSSWVDQVMSGLILAFAWILTSMAHDAYRVFADSVRIRQQQVQSNQQLRLALQRAESAMQAKTRFLASASHDLRQPMHALSLLGAALVRRPLDPLSADIGRSMNLALQSLTVQMDALLDISKLDAQVVPVNNLVFCFSTWLTRLCQELRPAAQVKGLSLTLDCPDAVYVDSDPVLLERVLRNLLDNAIKYTEHGQVMVQVELQPLDVTADATQAERLWQVSVRDSGCGIAPDEQARIFEEFYQVGNPQRDRAKGLGLGLSIVSRVVDLLDLNLNLQSTPGQGTCFSLSIAAAVAAPQPLAQPECARSLRPNLHVLVLDDEAAVRQAMQLLLSSHGCVVTLAASTREAVLKCMQLRPDILLTDLRLAGADDGITAVRSLRNALPGLPAVLISGDTAPERLREAQGLGLVLLHKPVLEQQLLDAIRTALAQQQQPQQPPPQTEPEALLPSGAVSVPS